MIEYALLAAFVLAQPKTYLVREHVSTEVIATPAEVQLRVTVSRYEGVDGGTGR